MSTVERQAVQGASLMEIAEQVERLRSEVAAAAIDFGREELAAELTAEGAGVGRSAGAACVVVVGEKKRGKSSLINALVGAEGLLPVDVDVATSCYIAVHHGRVRQAVAVTEDAPEGIAIDPAAIAEWASVEGNADPADPDRPLHPGVEGVDVAIDAPLLAGGLVLIDTPGVGGLEAGHTELTLASLARADALLFVIDPGGPLTAPELSFLERAAKQIATVVFAITKTDTHAGWQQILADDKALVSRYAPRFADARWVAVSSALAGDAAQALADGDAGTATELRQQSGLDELTAVLTDQVASDVPLLHLKNRLKGAESVMTELSIAEQLRLRAATGDPSLIDELDAQKAVLTSLADQQASWPHDLQRGFSELANTLQTDLHRRLRDARHTLQEKVAAWRAADHETFVKDVDAVIRSQWVDIDTQRQALVATLTAQLARQLSDEGFDALATELPYPDRLAKLPALSAHPPDEQTAAEYLPMISYGAGLHWFGPMFGLTALGGPLGIIIGLGAGIAANKTRRQRQELMAAQSDAVRYLSRVSEEATTELSVTLRQTLERDRDAIAERVNGLLDQRRTEVERDLEIARDAVETDQATQAAIRADAQARVQRLKPVAQRGLQVARRLEAPDDRPRAAL